MGFLTNPGTTIGVILLRFAWLALEDDPQASKVTEPRQFA